MQRAYSLLNVKEITERDDVYVVRGIASTPTTDRMGDVVEPMGAKFELPMPLLWQHDAHKPVGLVTFAKPQKDGIPFEAEIPRVTEPGTLKDRIDEAIQSLRYRLVAAVSIGFKEVEDQVERLKNGGYRFLEWTWLELSLVTIPANAEATITSVKSLCQAQRAASGRVVHLSPGDSGTNSNPKGPSVKTVQEQITALENKRAASVAQRDQIQMKAVEEGRSKDAAEKEQFDNLTAEVDTIDVELKDLRVMERQAVNKAAPIVAAAGASPAAAAAARSGVEVGTIVSVKPNVAKGIGFTRYMKAMVEARGDPHLALMHAQAKSHWVEQTPEVIEYLRMKTAVAAGTTTTSGWASQLVYNQNLVGEFVELLRPQTILGKMSGLTRVPFNIRVSGQDSGSTANWVGQGAGIPVSKLNTTEVTLGESKVAGLVVLTKELIRSSDPSAELLVRNDLMKTIATFCDVQFVDPNVAAVANVSPASITNGLTAITPTGTTAAYLRADVQTLFKSFINNNDDPTSCVWIMDPVMALAISLMQNALGQTEFAGITMNGGTFFGLPVVVSNSANIPGSPDSGHMIILAKASDILFADNDGLEIEASDQASIEMSDGPTNNAATPTANAYTVSMFQTNSVAIKAVRPINWKKRRATAVAYIKEAAYVA